LAKQEAAPNYTSWKTQRGQQKQTWGSVFSGTAGEKLLRGKGRKKAQEGRVRKGRKEPMSQNGGENIEIQGRLHLMPKRLRSKKKTLGVPLKKKGSCRDSKLREALPCLIERGYAKTGQARKGQ